MNDHSKNDGQPEQPKRGRGRPRTDDKRALIIEAALLAFADRGYHGTAVPDIAKAAGVGAGTVYRYFENKEDLVNEVFRDSKEQLRNAILDGLFLGGDQDSKALFRDLWGRLVAFARAEPKTFQFLEMQDHVPYLDDKSRQVELSVLVPMWLAAQEMANRKVLRNTPVEVLMAMAWGSLVGLLKAERIGYVRLTDQMLLDAGDAAWDLMARHDSAEGAS